MFYLPGMQSHPYEHTSSNDWTVLFLEHGTLSLRLTIIHSLPLSSSFSFLSRSFSFFLFSSLIFLCFVLFIFIFRIKKVVLIVKWTVLMLLSLTNMNLLTLGEIEVSWEHANITEIHSFCSSLLFDLEFDTLFSGVCTSKDSCASSCRM